MFEKRYTKNEICDLLLLEAQRIEGQLEVMKYEKEECEEYHDCGNGEHIALDDETIEQQEKWLVALREVAFNIRYGNIIK